MIVGSARYNMIFGNQIQIKF